jgi:hypothetical protein
MSTAKGTHKFTFGGVKKITGINENHCQKLLRLLASLYEALPLGLPFRARKTGEASQI